MDFFSLKKNSKTFCCFQWLPKPAWSWRQISTSSVGFCFLRFASDGSKRTQPLWKAGCQFLQIQDVCLLFFKAGHNGREHKKWCPPPPGVGLMMLRRGCGPLLIHPLKESTPVLPYDKPAQLKLRFLKKTLISKPGWIWTYSGVIPELTHLGCLLCRTWIKYMDRRDPWDIELFPHFGEKCFTKSS